MDALPLTLIDLLSNDIALRELAPLLPVSSLFALLRVNKPIRETLLSNSEVWRYLDLTTVKIAQLDTRPIDVGGTSWRAERMDEALTEDDFYAGPLRGIFNRLQRAQSLQYVQVLVLDGMTVPADLIREIVCEDRFSVRILSIRECNHLNQSKLQQVLRYAVRPTRPQGTPKLKALYCFGKKKHLRTVQIDAGQRTLAGITATTGARIGAHSDALPEVVNQEWHLASGRMMKSPQSEWPDTLQVCKGIIAFDAILCQGPRHDITKVSSTDYVPSTIASIALGQHGCEICGSCPEGMTTFTSGQRPLIAPAPTHAVTVRAAQLPFLHSDSAASFVLRCEDCLRGRWCERCLRWWCETCYEHPTSRHNRTQEEMASLEEGGWQVRGHGAPVKLGVHRDCFDCGHTCANCSARYMRTCQWCRASYCYLDDEGSTEKLCSWCSYSGRRTQELY